MAFAVHHERVPASGVEHCVAIRLVRDEAAWPPSRGRLVCHAVLARENVLRVMEVRQRADGACVLVQVGMHHLFGQVTGLHAVRTLASQIDGRDRLLISFRDAKVSLMEWDDVYHDPTAISLHTFERAPPLAQGLPPTFVPHTMVDQASRAPPSCSRMTPWRSYRSSRTSRNWAPTTPKISRCWSRCRTCPHSSCRSATTLTSTSTMCVTACSYLASKIQRWLCCTRANSHGPAA